MVRRLAPEDAEAYRTLRREALQREPFSFGSSPDEDRARSFELRPRDDGRSRRGIRRIAPELVGAVGVRGLPRKKTRHKAEIF